MSAVASDLLPPDEEARLAAVRRYEVLDTPPDGAFDRITALAARVCRVPISTITIVDVDRIWFLSSSGLEVDQVGRHAGLCASAILGQLPYVVVDASTDPRTLQNPLVRGELGLRFYAGVPLTTRDGYNLGTLNIIDVEPREIAADDLGVLQDLAAIVLDELELRLVARRTVQIESTRQALQLRDAIVAGISHEMRTPLAILNGILGVERASLERPDGVAPDMHAMMARQVRHLDWLVKQFLDYASLEGERPPVVQLEPVDLTQLVSEATEVFADRATIQVQAACGRAVALADRDRTWQICLELINNAARFGPPEGPIEVVVRASDDGRQVRVTVTDRGPGIEPAMQARMFDPTYRHSSSTGSGVGLYVSQVFAQAQGGDIEVDSQPGRGSSFSLVLPVAADGT